MEWLSEFELGEYEGEIGLFGILWMRLRKVTGLL